MTTHQTSLDDPKVAAILEAAFVAFLKFGFKRASMADIAAGAGMSRAALYLHFKNKDDIFQSMIAAYYDEGIVALEQALTKHTNAVDLIKACFAALTEAYFPALLDSPHGAEFLDAKTVAFGDATREGDAMIAQAFAKGLSAAAADGRISLNALGADPEHVAVVMLKAMFGLKVGAQSYDSFAKDRDLLGGLFGRALKV